ncbi:GNAT family N-acetyltransferase (plasmid) [Alkalihalophilus pseudofirmus]|uniref:GNAT family N-acetyltransferase n=1 Tax=Alkalihalophilus pseudofirmus TaxID=79885 RepID=UPI00259BABC0|nr:GNAT family N-acetyltransferase [Alkalihalophilus pseudofirmus]WEG19260.1 GNAT family N-acetyltransferase [Alkalihalophilus pseudofirmus]
MHKIRLARQNDLDRILFILNQTTLDLKQKGINQWHYPWDDNKVLNQVMNDSTYILLLNNEIVGTFCISEIDKINELQVEPLSKYLTQIAILPELQGMNLGKRIINFAGSLVEELNKPLYLDCWAGNKKLKEFYLNNNFVFIGDYPEENYFVSIFQYNFNLGSAKGKFKFV